MTNILRIRKRADFLRARQAKNNAVTAGLVLEVVASEFPEDSTLRIGFTASAKVGNAVRRNRIKRRLRAAAREVMSSYSMTGNDYVIIGRFRAFDRNFASLIKDLKYALHSTGTFKN